MISVITVITEVNRASGKAAEAQELAHVIREQAVTGNVLQPGFAWQA